MEEDKNFNKIIVVGDSTTGKTNLIYTFLKDKAPNNIVPTVAVQFSSKTVEIKDYGNVKAQIWDTAGQEAYRSLTMNHYRNANGALIVFDVTKRSSFEHAHYWLQNVRERAEINVQILLVGHKIDSSRREVQKRQGQQLAKSQNIVYMETTITDVSSITAVFKTLLTKILQTNRVSQRRSSAAGRKELVYQQPSSGRQSGGNDGGQSRCCC